MSFPMFSFINRTVFDIPLTWDRIRFESTRAKCRKARKLIEFSLNGKTKTKNQLILIMAFTLQFNWKKI